MLRTVYMAAKFASLFTKLADAGQREYLETAAVGKDGTVPCVELMKTACFAERVKSGPG